MGIFILILELEDYWGERDIIIAKGLIFQEDIRIIICLCLTIKYQNILAKQMTELKGDISPQL